MLRSIKKAHEIILQDDPETAVTLYTIRHWCIEGKIRYLKAGNRMLVDVDSLLNYLKAQ